MKLIYLSHSQFGRFPWPHGFGANDLQRGPNRGINKVDRKQHKEILSKQSEKNVAQVLIYKSKDTDMQNAPATTVFYRTDNANL